MFRKKLKLGYLAVAAGLLIFFSGCVSNQELSKPTGQGSPTATVSPASTQISQSAEQNKINELESKINSMQQQINDLQSRINRVDLLKPSNKSLIPHTPFKIEVYWSKMDTPMTYTFRDGINEVTINNGYNDIQIATYTLYRNNNTIKLNSEKIQFYGLALYDDYIASIYENGWIGWVTKYKVFPPTYNTVTQKYELN